VFGTSCAQEFGVRRAEARFQPPFCPNPDCDFHQKSTTWRFKRIGFYLRQTPPHRVQRYLCTHCNRSFGTQTFHPTYWLKRPDLLQPLFWRLLACSGYRQIAREFAVSPTTVLGQAARLGRHCWLVQEQHRPRSPLAEPLVIDGFESFEYSQYWPLHLNTAVGAHSHFVYAFTDSELRRKGRMTPHQRRRRTELEARYGRPDPKSIEKGVAELLRLVVRGTGSIEVRSDEHPAYPHAFRRLVGIEVTHRMTHSTAPRTPQNPLFPANLLDLLIRHNGSNHKRETIAFSKRRQSAVERMAVLQVWRNFMKPVSERRRDATPAERLGITRRRWGIRDLLGRRLFPSRVGFPERLGAYYRREIETRQLGANRRHALRYAF
jgi:transposase-like protein